MLQMTKGWLLATAAAMSASAASAASLSDADTIFVHAFHTGYVLADGTKPFNDRSNTVVDKRLFYTRVVEIPNSYRNRGQKFNESFCADIEARFSDPYEKESYGCRGGFFTVAYATREEAEKHLADNLASYQEGLRRIGRNYPNSAPVEVIVTDFIDTDARVVAPGG